MKSVSNIICVGKDECNIGHWFNVFEGVNTSMEEIKMKQCAFV